MRARHRQHERNARRSPGSPLRRCARRRWLLWLLIAVLALLPAPVSAHSGSTFGGGIIGPWIINPVVWLGLMLVGTAYFYATGAIEVHEPDAVGPHQLWYFLGGLGVVFVALTSPIDYYADNAFWVHMIQHLLLMIVAPPLLLVGTPAALLRPLTHRPALLRLLRVFVNPGMAWLLSTSVFLLWHVPTLYDAAVLDAKVHALEHLSFLLSALLFWWTIYSPLPALPPLSRANQVLYLALSCQPNVILGAVLVFAPHAFYGVYGGALRLGNINPLTDQQIGGAIMWVPGNVAYLGILTKIFFNWFNEHEAAQAGTPGTATARRES